MRIGGEPVGEHAAGAAGADDDVVEGFHGLGLAVGWSLFAGAAGGGGAGAGLASLSSFASEPSRLDRHVLDPAAIAGTVAFIIQQSYSRLGPRGIGRIGVAAAHERADQPVAHLVGRNVDAGLGLDHRAARRDQRLLRIGIGKGADLAVHAGQLHRTFAVEGNAGCRPHFPKGTRQRRVVPEQRGVEGRTGGLGLAQIVKRGVVDAARQERAGEPGCRQERKSQTRKNHAGLRIWPREARATALL